MYAEDNDCLVDVDVAAIESILVVGCSSINVLPEYLPLYKSTYERMNVITWKLATAPWPSTRRRRPKFSLHSTTTTITFSFQLFTSRIKSLPAQFENPFLLMMPCKEDKKQNLGFLNSRRTELRTLWLWRLHKFCSCWLWNKRHEHIEFLVTRAQIGIDEYFIHKRDFGITFCEYLVWGALCGWEISNIILFLPPCSRVLFMTQPVVVEPNRIIQRW